MRLSIFSFLACLGLLTLASSATAGAGGGPPPDYFVDESALPFEALPGATALWGVHTNAGYRVEVPDAWNGDLVVWAHGFRGTGLELDHPCRGVQELTILAAQRRQLLEATDPIHLQNSCAMTRGGLLIRTPAARQPE